MEAIKSGTEIIGNRVRARIVKNKVAAPFRVAELEFLFKEGISKEGALLDLGVEHGILKKSGSFFSYGDTRLGQGREASRTFLKREVAIRTEIDAGIRAIVAAKASPPDPTLASAKFDVSEPADSSDSKN